MLISELHWLQVNKAPLMHHLTSFLSTNQNCFLMQRLIFVFSIQTKLFYIIFPHNSFTPMPSDIHSW